MPNIYVQIYSFWFYIYIFHNISNELQIAYIYILPNAKNFFKYFIKILIQ